MNKEQENMKKFLAAILIMSLITTMPVFADDAVNVPKADKSKNTITTQNKINPGRTLNFRVYGDRQSAIGTIDGETRYRPSSYEIDGPDDYYIYGYYDHPNYSKSRILKRPGKYKITIEYDREAYDQLSNSWHYDDSNDFKIKTVTVKRPKYKITLNANKGKIGGKKKVKRTVSYGKRYGKFKAAKRSGYKFKGWYSKKSGGKKITKYTKVSKLKSHKLYAHWKKIKVKKTKTKTTTKITTPKSKTVYITDTGAKYHRGSCRYLQYSKYKISLKNAKAQGYTACKVCKP